MDTAYEQCPWEDSCLNLYGYVSDFNWSMSNMSKKKHPNKRSEEKTRTISQLKSSLQETECYFESERKLIITHMDIISARMINRVELVLDILSNEGVTAEAKKTPQLRGGLEHYCLKLAPWYQKHLHNLDQIMFYQCPSKEHWQLGIELTSLETVIEQFSEKERRIIQSPYQYAHSSDKEGIEQVATIVNRFVDAIRAYFEQPHVKKQLRDLHANLGQRKKNCIQLFNSLLNKFSKILVVRIDLAFIRDINTIMKRYHTLSDLHSKNDLEALKACVEKFLKNRRHNKILDAIEGYILRFEYSVRTGFHVHMYLFFDGNKHREDISLGQYIADYWKTITDGQGTAFICNMQKEKYRNCGIGMIHYHDEEKRTHLIKTFDYICKADQFFKFSNMVGARSFQMSQPVEKKGNSGRPRKYSTKSPAPSQMSLVFVE